MIFSGLERQEKRNLKLQTVKLPIKFTETRLSLQTSSGPALSSTAAQEGQVPDVSNSGGQADICSLCLHSGESCTWWFQKKQSSRNNIFKCLVESHRVYSTSNLILRLWCPFTLTYYRSIENRIMASPESINMLHVKKQSGLQRIKVVNQLTFKTRDYPVLSEWIKSNSRFFFFHVKSGFLFLRVRQQKDLASHPWLWKWKKGNISQEMHAAPSTWRMKKQTLSHCPQTLSETSWFQTNVVFLILVSEL